MVTAMTEAIRFTKLSVERYNAMIAALNSVNSNQLDGDIVECGVWQGGNIILARAMCPDKICWLYDTFEGMTRPDPVLDIKLSGKPVKAIDRYDAKTVNGQKWAAVSMEDVKKNFDSFGLMSDSHLKFVKGDVLNTLLEATNIPEKVSLLRLDTDWYHSTRVELEVLYPKLVRNGILIIDDYGHWAGCKKAVDDYFKDKPVHSAQIDYTAIMIVKPC